MTNQNQSEGLSPQEFWIYKGSSGFCSELIMDEECETFVRQKPDGFYDIVSDRDTIEGGVKVIEHSAYQALKEEDERLRSENVALIALIDLKIDNEGSNE